MNNNNINDSTDLGGFTIGQWRERRILLKTNLDYSDQWEEVINWYDQRLKRRYFSPMRRMEDNSVGEGFSLTTIHCALIEHFASITQGKIHNFKMKKNSPDYEYKFSSDILKEFLETSDIFSEYFSPQTGTPEFDSKDFYSNVRCALLHEACTKNNWKINTLSCGYVNPTKQIMLKYDSGIKRIFRDVLTDKLSNFITDYKAKLKTEYKLRLFFARKFDHLCEIPSEPTNYPWWEENKNIVA